MMSRTLSIVLLGLSIAASAHAQRMVFAHYMLANQDPALAADPTGEQAIAAYQKEIQLAQAMGIDGFALNAGGWFKESHYILRASEMFEAAYRLQSHFVLFFSADMCCGNNTADVEDMLRRFANNPRYASIYYRKDGRAVLTTFAGSSYGASFWLSLRHDLENGKDPSTRLAPNALALVSGIPSSAPLPVYFVPAFFWGGELPKQTDVASGLAEYRKIVDGAFYWGIAGSPGLGHVPDQLPSSAAYAETLHSAGKLYMAPVCFQFWGSNAARYYEYNGYAGMRAMWMQAIRVTHPEWIEIITWNDFVEGTYITPDAPAGYPTHRGAASLLPHFIRWYKTAQEPALPHDAVFWSYRTHLAPKNTTLHLYGPLADVIYITANLKQAATLHIRFAGHSTDLTLPAGSHDVQVPAFAGKAPHFELQRDGILIVAGDGEEAIASDTKPYLYYTSGSMHD